MKKAPSDQPTLIKTSFVYDPVPAVTLMNVRTVVHPPQPWVASLSAGNNLLGGGHVGYWH